MDAIARFAEHVARTRFDDLSAGAVAAAETFVLDTVGVGIAGSSGPMAAELAELQGPDVADGAHVWSTGHRMAPSAAALCNAYQVHNSEFDCLHEEAVAHVMLAVVPAAFAQAERSGGIDGKHFLEAVVTGVDVASNLGIAAASGLRFFRPATVGAFGATAAVGKLMGFDADRLVHAFSLVYGQLCGTMQAHEEGSMLLAMQMGFNARNAVVACELAGAGFTGPANVLQGRFGYFSLYESGGDPQAAAATLGRIWRVAELAHKPFPCGRATHGIIDGCLILRERQAIDPAQIEHVDAAVPALVHQLVARPSKAVMDTNYARLSAPYVAARALIRGTVGFEDFQPSAYADKATQLLAQKIAVRVCERFPPNGLTPIELTIKLSDGACHELLLSDVYGSPQKPMTRDSQLEKFRTNCAVAAKPIPTERVDSLIHVLTGLNKADDIGSLAPMLVG